MFWVGFACGVAAFLASAIVLAVVADLMSRGRRRLDPDLSQARDLPIALTPPTAANENRAARTWMRYRSPWRRL
jgi:hypothetical protein